MSTPTKELVEALRWALDHVEDSLDPDHQAALEAAKATLARHTGPTFVENPPDGVYLQLILAGRTAEALEHVRRGPWPWKVEVHRE